MWQQHAAARSPHDALAAAAVIDQEERPQDLRALGISELNN